MNRDAAIDLAEQGARRDWLRVAQRATLYHIRKGLPFSADDVWRTLSGDGQPDWYSHPVEPRALGCVFRQLRREGRIEPCGFESSARPSRNGGPVRLWIASPEGDECL
jgi:hypothetical protein